MNHVLHAMSIINAHGTLLTLKKVLFRFSSEIGVSDIEFLPLKENTGAPSQKQLFIFLVFRHSGLVT